MAARAWVVARDSVGHVAREDRLQSNVGHRPDPDRLARRADVGVEAHVDQMRDASILAERVKLLRAVGDEVGLADLQDRVHPVPAEVAGALEPWPAHAAVALEAMDGCKRD